MEALEIPKQVERQLKGGDVWTGRDFTEHYEGLLQAVRGAGGAQRKLFAAAIFAALVSDDLAVRSGAVAVLEEIAPDIGAERLSKLIKENPDLFAGVRPGVQVGHDDLEKAAVLSFLRVVTPADKGAIAWLRALAKERPWGNAVLATLARVDGEWLVEHADLVPHANLGVLVPLSPAQRRRLVEARAPYPPESSSPLVAAFWKQLPAGEVSALKALMWPGGAS